jgi:hypothetical protein
MHPRKAKALARLLEIARIKDEALKDGLAVVRAPDQYGWTGSVTAAAMLPLTALGATLNDLSIILASPIPDATWEKAFPGPGNS